jgi:hypothetical protein
MSAVDLKQVWTIMGAVAFRLLKTKVMGVSELVAVMVILAIRIYPSVDAAPIEEKAY